jgi:hypothetical protein
MDLPRYRLPRQLPRLAKKGRTKQGKWLVYIRISKPKQIEPKLCQIFSEWSALTYIG